MTKYTKIDVPVAQARMKDCFQFYVRNIIIQSWCHRTCYVHKFISPVFVFFICGCSSESLSLPSPGVHEQPGRRRTRCRHIDWKRVVPTKRPTEEEIQILAGTSNDRRCRGGRRGLRASPIRGQGWYGGVEVRCYSMCCFEWILPVSCNGFAILFNAI